MGRAHPETVATARELADVLNTLESRRWFWKPFHVRRYLADLESATDGGFGRTRLYSVEDACLVRLAAQLEHEGLSPWAVRAVVANHADALRRAFASDAPTSFAVRGVRAKLITGVERVQVPTGVVTVSLQSVRRGVPEAIARIRRDDPTIHMFNRRLPVRDALRLAPNSASW